MEIEALIGFLVRKSNGSFKQESLEISTSNASRRCFWLPSTLPMFECRCANPWYHWSTSVTWPLRLKNAQKQHPNDLKFNCRPHMLCHRCTNMKLHILFAPSRSAFSSGFFYAVQSAVKEMRMNGNKKMYAPSLANPLQRVFLIVGSSQWQMSPVWMSEIPCPIHVIGRRTNLLFQEFICSCKLRPCR